MMWFFLSANFFFAIVAIYFSYRYERKTDEVRRQQKEISRRVFELSLLQWITDKIGYSLNIETISENIALAVENIFDLTTVSYAIRDGSKIRLKTMAKGAVPAPYLTELAKIINSGMVSIDPNLANHTLEQTVVNVSQADAEKSILGLEGDIKRHFDTIVSQESLQETPQSFFNIPLVVENHLVGMINIASKKKITYEEEDIKLLRKIVETAQNAMHRLSDVIKTEESKLDSLILTLPSGTIMFTLDSALDYGRVINGDTQVAMSQFKVSVINQAAKDFLRITLDTGVSEVLSRFAKEIKMEDQIHNVFTSKKATTVPDAKIYDRYFEIFINPVFVPNKDILLGVALIMRDISPEKKLEKIRADFTDMMMHELRAPLTAIRGAAALLLANNLNQEEKDKMPRIILDSSVDMLSSVSDFLDAAKIDEGKFKLTLLNSDLTIVVSEHVEVFSYAAKEKNITINFDKSTEVPKFLFDPIRVGQVINNLLSNSIKFTNSGGEIDIRITKLGQDIEVEVKDNGIGIADNKKAILFTKFGQIDHNSNNVNQNSVVQKPSASTGTQTPSSGSSGLGLFICHNIVDAHGGKIWLDSTENLGTIVHFTIPFITEEKAAEAHAMQLSN